MPLYFGCFCVSDTYNPVPGVMGGVPSSRNYDGGFASALMVCDLTWFLLELELELESESESEFNSIPILCFLFKAYN